MKTIITAKIFFKLDENDNMYIRKLSGGNYLHTLTIDSVEQFLVLPVNSLNKFLFVKIISY